MVMSNQSRWALGGLVVVGLAAAAFQIAATPGPSLVATTPAPEAMGVRPGAQGQSGEDLPTDPAGDAEGAPQAGQMAPLAGDRSAAMRRQAQRLQTAADALANTRRKLEREGGAPETLAALDEHETRLLRRLEGARGP
jgi:hypothetical protein